MKQPNASGLEIVDHPERRKTDQIILNALVALVSELLAKARPKARKHTLHVNGEMEGRFASSGTIEVKVGKTDAEAGLIVSPRGSSTSYICMLVAGDKKSATLMVDLDTCLPTRVYHQPEKSIVAKPVPEEKKLTADEKFAAGLIQEILAALIVPNQWWSLDEVLEAVFVPRNIDRRHAKALVKGMVEAKFLDKSKKPPLEYRVKKKWRE